MKVGVRALWHVIVDDDVHSLNVHSSSKQISGHHDTLVEALEGLVLGQPEGEKKGGREGGREGEVENRV